MTGLIQEIGNNDFHDAFRRMNRHTKFTYAGLNALYAYLIELSVDTGEPVVLDVIALCCDYTEYAEFDEFKKDYGITEIATMEDLESNTVVIPVDAKSFIIQNF